MRVKKAGKVDDHLWLLGTEESCVYILEGEESSVIISGGLSYILPDFFRQMQEFGISENKIAHIILLHAHFDHVGIVPFLKRKWPHLNVYASIRGWQTLSNPKAISIINQYTKLVAARVLGTNKELAAFDWQWRDDLTGLALTEESSLDLGNLKIQFYETPGHSSCSISVYVPQKQILFPSDAVAIPYGNEYIVVASSNMNQYQKSLEKMSKLDVKILGADHYGYIEGDEAKSYIHQSKIAASEMEKNLIGVLQKEGSVEQAAKMLVERHYQLRPQYFVAPEILIGTYRQMLKQYKDE